MSEYNDDLSDDDEPYDGESQERCHWCGGEGWDGCDDPIQCTRSHNKFGECQCGSCGGSGLAKDMTIW